MFKRLLAAIALTVCFAFCGCGGYYDGPPAFKYYVTADKTVFGSGINAFMAVRGGKSEQALLQMQQELDYIDSQFSLTKDSPIAQFNSSDAYVKTEVSETVYNLLSECIELYAQTDGLFNIAVLPLSKLWNVDSAGLNKYAYSSPESCPSPPDYDTVTSLISDCDLSALHLEQTDGKRFIYKSNPALKIDLGAIAKGYAADRCIKIASDCGAQSALINISGNISLLGEWYNPAQRKYTRWEIGVTSPRPKGGSVDGFALSVGKNKTLVTSGDYARFYTTSYGGGLLSVPHIISGVSGLPLGIEYNGGYRASDDFIISATVICNNSALADAYATAICLMPQDRAVSFMQSHWLHGALFTADGKLLLVGITESDDGGEEYFIYKNEYSLYKQYKVETVG